MSFHLRLPALTVAASLCAPPVAKAGDDIDPANIARLFPAQAMTACIAAYEQQNAGQANGQRIAVLPDGLSCQEIDVHYSGFDGTPTAIAQTCMFFPAGEGEAPSMTVNTLNSDVSIDLGSNRFVDLLNGKLFFKDVSGEVAGQLVPILQRTLDACPQQVSYLTPSNMLAELAARKQELRPQ